MDEWVEVFSGTPEEIDDAIALLEEAGVQVRHVPGGEQLSWSPGVLPPERVGVLREQAAHARELLGVQQEQVDEHLHKTKGAAGRWLLFLFAAAALFASISRMRGRPRWIALGAAAMASLLVWIYRRHQLEAHDK